MAGSGTKRTERVEIFAITHCGGHLVTSDEGTGGWRVLTDGEIRSRMIGAGLDPACIEIGEIPPKTFKLGVRVTHFTSPEAFMSYLRLHFYYERLELSPDQNLFLSNTAMSSQYQEDPHQGMGADGVGAELGVAAEAEVATKEDVASSSEEEAAQAGPLRPRRARIGIEPATQEAVPRWAAAMGIDLDDYRIIVVDGPVNRKLVRVRKDMVAFYRAHFEIGLRLPLDPFFCEFLTLTSSVPIDLNMQTVRLLVSFAIVCRSLGFEPRLNVFFHFHTTQVLADLLSTRSLQNGPQLFKKPPNKIHHWNDHFILVESRRGWNFPVPRASHDRKTVKSTDVTAAEDLAMVEAIHQALGVVESPKGKFISQRKRFDWNQLVSSDEWLWLAGLTKKPIEGIMPWVTIPNQPSHEGWIIHFGEMFGDECPSCAQGDLCPPMAFNFDVGELRQLQDVHASDRATRETQLRGPHRTQRVPAGTPSPPRKKVRGHGKKGKRSCQKNLQGSDEAETDYVEHVGEISRAATTVNFQTATFIPPHVATSMYQRAPFPSTYANPIGGPSWASPEFVQPSSAQNVTALAFEMSDVPDLTGINLDSRAPPQLMLGLGSLTRLQHKGMVQDMKSLGSDGLAARAGLAIVEMANVVIALNEELAEEKRLMGITSKVASAHESRAAKLEAELEATRKQFEDLSVIHSGCADLLATRDREIAQAMASRKEFDRERARFTETLTSFERNKHMEIEVARREAVVAYKVSAEFKQEMGPEVLSYFDRGADHILRIAASSQKVDMNDITSWKLEDPYGHAARSGHSWVPYCEKDLEIIQKRDARNKLSTWNPPPLNDDNLCTRLNPA